MRWQNKTYHISDDLWDLQIDRIHKFLSTEAYWCLGIPKKTLERAIGNSMCFGVFDETTKLQVGFARVVTDRATFAWVCDVYIEQDHRGLGLAKWLMECIMGHTDLQGLRRMCLATKDAHQLYSHIGFKPTSNPGNWMEINNNDIYKKPIN